MEIIELHFSNIDEMNNYVKHKKNTKNKYIEHCIKCYKAYEWVNYPTTDNEDTDEDEEETIFYNGEEIDKFQNWLIKEKHWHYHWNAHMFQCPNCYVKLLENKIKDLENNKLECVLL